MNLYDGARIFENRATVDGGGIDTEGDDKVGLRGGSIFNNVADQQGGGIYTQGLVVLDRGSIDHNKAGDNGGGIYATILREDEPVKPCGRIIGDRKLVHDNSPDDFKIGL